VPLGEYASKLEGKRYFVDAVAIREEAGLEGRIMALTMAMDAAGKASRFDEALRLRSEVEAMRQHAIVDKKKLKARKLRALEAPPVLSVDEALSRLSDVDEGAAERLAERLDGRLEENGQFDDGSTFDDRILRLTDLRVAADIQRFGLFSVSCGLYARTRLTRQRQENFDYSPPEAWVSLTKKAQAVLDAGIEELDKAAELLSFAEDRQKDTDARDLEDQMLDPFVLNKLDVFVRLLSVVVRLARWVNRACVDEALFGRPPGDAEAPQKLEAAAKRLIAFRAMTLEIIDDNDQLHLDAPDHYSYFGEDDLIAESFPLPCSLQDLENLVTTCACGITLRPLDNDPEDNPRIGNFLVISLLIISFFLAQISRDSPLSLRPSTSGSTKYQTSKMSSCLLRLTSSFTRLPAHFSHQGPANGGVVAPEAMLSFDF